MVKPPLDWPFVSPELMPGRVLPGGVAGCIREVRHRAVPGYLSVEADRGRDGCAALWAYHDRVMASLAPTPDQTSVVAWSSGSRRTVTRSVSAEARMRTGMDFAAGVFDCSS